MTVPKVSIIVLNWNGRDDTLECLESLRALDYPRREVVVVDNGSEDGSVSSIGAAFPEAKLIETGKNLGYAGGNNAGLEYVLRGDAEFVLLLNNDTKVDPKIVSELVAASRSRPDAAFFSPKIYIYSEPTRIWFAGGRWMEAKARFFHLGQGIEDTDGQFATVKDIDYVCGCALFARTSVIRQIGLLDERFFLVFEDVDWCYRARAAGFKLIFVPQAVLWHKASKSFGGSASPMISYFHTRNRLLWGKKHLSKRGFFSLCGAIYSELLPSFRLPHLTVDSNVKAPLIKKLYWICFQYATEVRKWVSDLRRELGTAHVRGCLYGVRDFVLGRFGKPDVGTLERFGER